MQSLSNGGKGWISLAQDHNFFQAKELHLHLTDLL